MLPDEADVSGLRGAVTKESPLSDGGPSTSVIQSMTKL